jgi:hypothetical protein
MSIEEALAEHEVYVDELLKVFKKYSSAVNAWKGACKTGNTVVIQKSAAIAEELVKQLEEPTNIAAKSWIFDTRAYLESDEWRAELKAKCKDVHQLRVFEEDETLVVPPVIIKAEPGKSRIVLGRENWPTLHPEFTAAYLKKLNAKPPSVPASQQFLDSVYEGCKRYHPTDLSIRFAELYNHWCGAPGWKKENTKASMAQRIYELNRSGIQTTKDQKEFRTEGPVGKYSERDVFEIVGADGKLERYYSIWFK